jgi:hypothetical protein
MAVIETINIDGAIVKFNDYYIRSRTESEELMQRAADIALKQLNAQHNAKRYKEHNENTAE